MIYTFMMTVRNQIATETLAKTTPVTDCVNKGLLRILGMLVAGSVALLLAVLFPQDRWIYLFTTTLYIGLCTYTMGHSSRCFCGRAGRPRSTRKWSATSRRFNGGLSDTTSPYLLARQMIWTPQCCAGKRQGSWLVSRPLSMG